MFVKCPLCKSEFTLNIFKEYVIFKCSKCSYKQQVSRGEYEKEVSKEVSKEGGR